jgi:hypothetical protein
MNYVTSIYLVSEVWDGSPKEHLRRIVKRALSKIHLGIPFFIPALERSQVVLGDSMLFILDANLKSHPNGKILYDAIVKAKLHIKEVALKPSGIYPKKWACMMSSFEDRSGPTIWMDGTDVEVVDSLSEDEEKFISDKALAMGIAAELVSCHRCIERNPLINADGSPSSRHPTQIQLATYCLPDGSIAEACYKMDIDDDQLALTYHLQETKGWYQNVFNQEIASAMTSGGLFRVCPPAHEYMLPFLQPPIFKPKIIHKPDWWKKDYS